MKALLLTFTLILGTMYCAQSQTQDTVTVAIVVLNDGSIIKGERIAPTKPGYIRLRMKDGTELEVPVESVAEIRKDMPRDNSRGRQPLKPHQVRSKGFYASISTGLLFGGIGQNPLSLANSAALGYRFLPQLYLAGGAGTDIYGVTGYVFAPVFLRVGGEAMKTRVSPSYYFSGGYAFPVEWPDQYSSIKGGPFYEGGFGATFRNAGRIYWTLHFVYRQHKTEGTYTDWWGGGIDNQVKETRTYRRFGIVAGMCF
ncbi:hypothetical protein BH09BAC1_BH09BAC1_25860 [soil metagenome]